MYKTSRCARKPRLSKAVTPPTSGGGGADETFSACYRGNKLPVSAFVQRCLSVCLSGSSASRLLMILSSYQYCIIFKNGNEKTKKKKKAALIKPEGAPESRSGLISKLIHGALSAFSCWSDAVVGPSSPRLVSLDWSGQRKKKLALREYICTGTQWYLFGS